MGVAPSLRVVESGADLDAWARLENAIVPNEPVTAEQIRATDEEGRLLLLAELDGNPVGCGIAARSHFADTRTCRCRVMSRSTSTNGCATRRPARTARSLRSSRAKSSAMRVCWSMRTAPAVAEHGLTVVCRDRRRRGIAHALKRAQLEWAARSGLVELVTWTQKGNEAMQSIKRSLGYVDHARVLTYTGPLSSPLR
jgi:GNAT superfamily N-acetyltransferase